MVKDQSRRNFLWTAPLAAAVALPFTDTLLSASTVPAEAGQGFQTPTPAPYKLFKADAIREEGKAAASAPKGTKDLINDPTLPFAVAITTESKHNATEFEFHEGRDHILQVLEGSTVLEIGGKPQGAHSATRGEWLAPTSNGATKITLNKGDMLTVPRGTPHKRTTPESVTFLLISPTGMLM